MSLYNLVFVVNQLTPVLLKIIGVDFNSIPRFRDTAIQGERVLIRTRTGGGNDECFCDQEPCSEGCYYKMNRALESLPNCEEFYYDDYDSTYAYFEFSPLEEFKNVFSEIIEVKQGKRESVGDAFKSFIEKMQSKGQ